MTEKDEIIKLVKKGMKNRTTKKHEMNERSSRGHAIITLKIQKLIKDRKNSNENYSLTESIVHLADLAGSERAYRAGTEDIRLNEGGKINFGLLCLSNCLKSLANKKRGMYILLWPFFSLLTMAFWVDKICRILFVFYRTMCVTIQTYTS